MAKVMLSKEEYLRRQGTLNEATTCCGKSKVLGLIVLMVGVAIGLTFFLKRKA